jgi:molecular chaperone DnaK (HSP70)
MSGGVQGEEGAEQQAGTREPWVSIGAPAGFKDAACQRCRAAGVGSGCHSC